MFMPGNLREFGTATRARIAELAARIIAEEGIDSYSTAKRKAAERLGVKTPRELPDNREIEMALSQYQRLFQRDTQPEHLQQRREIACAAMDMFCEFSPRLVGPVLSGTAGQHSLVNLHLFTDAPEEVGFVLMDRAIPHQLGEKRLRQNSKLMVNYPSFLFVAGGVTVELVVFPSKESRQAPLSPLDGKPMRRADLTTVKALLVKPPSSGSL
jgi:hypothetical protein